MASQHALVKILGRETAATDVLTELRNIPMVIVEPNGRGSVVQPQVIVSRKDFLRFASATDRLRGAAPGSEVSVLAAVRPRGNAEELSTNELNIAPAQSTPQGWKPGTSLRVDYHASVVAVEDNVFDALSAESAERNGERNVFYTDSETVDAVLQDLWNDGAENVFMPLSQSAPALEGAGFDQR